MKAKSAFQTIVHALFPLGVVLSVSGCMVSRQLPVGYDYSYRGEFKNYRSFDYLSQSLPDASNSNSLVETYIASRLNFLGFKLSESKPDILVGYQIISDSLRINIYDQPSVGSWVQ
jgi:hypothetical protein